MRGLGIGAAWVTVLVTGLWVAFRPGWDSSAALAAAVVALVGSFFLRKQGESAQQIQSVERGGIGVQAGRDVSIRDIGRGSE